MCLDGPLLNEQPAWPVGCSGTEQRDLFSATRNQTFSGGEEKLLFLCANFVDQTKSASSKCSDKDMDCCMCRVDPNGEPNANHLRPLVKFTKIIASTFVACSQTLYFFIRDRRSIFSLEIVDFAYENKSRGGYIDQ